jgi:hypothetical protein
MRSSPSTQQEEIAARSKQLQDAVNDYNQFNRMVTLASFFPFTSAAQALENANDISRCPQPPPQVAPQPRHPPGQQGQQEAVGCSAWCC